MTGNIIIKMKKKLIYVSAVSFGILYDYKTGKNEISLKRISKFYFSMFPETFNTLTYNAVHRSDNDFSFIMSLLSIPVGLEGCF